jgi:hypothetical protein
MKKIILFIAVSLTLVVALLFLFLNNKTDTIALTTFPKAYNLVSLYQESEEFEVNIYIAGQDPYPGKRENIRSSFLSDDLGENRLNLELLAVEKQTIALELEKDLYYLYQFRFLLEFSTAADFTIEMPRAVLNLEMMQSDALRISIGSFTLTKISAFGSEDIRIARMKGVVNQRTGQKTLVGVAMEVVNKSATELKITGLTPLDVNLNPSSSIHELPNLQFHSGEILETLLGTAKTEAVIAPGASAYLLFPLAYNNLLSLNKLGFYIDYQSEDKSGRLYFNEYTFYNSYAHSAEEVNKLIIHTYENH